MCLIDSKELDRIVATHDNSKELAAMANKIIARLVDEKYTPEFDNTDLCTYPRINFVRKEVL